MPEYVYGLHDFHPENEDEVGFRAGDRIEVIEKDNFYEDGWWKGRNPAGQEGLFPVGYTTPSSPEINGVNYSEPDVTMSTLQPLQEEPETESPPIFSPVARPPSVPSFLNINGAENSKEAPQEVNGVFHSRKPSASDGEVMRATMTDVQKAIEQLGRDGAGADDYDGARSFSFASTKEGADTETDDTDFDLSDLDGGFQHGDKGDWHKNARRKLAVKAKQAVENAKQLEAMMNSSLPTSRRTAAPPIDAEMSDESEVEDEDFTKSNHLQRTHPGILEEDENDLEGPSQVTSAETQNLIEVPSKDDSDIPTASANVQAFVVPLEPPTASSISFGENSSLSGSQEDVEKSRGRSAKSSYPTPTSLFEPTAAIGSRSAVEDPKRSSYPLLTNDLPISGQVGHASQSKHSSMVSSSSAPLPTSQMQVRQSMDQSRSPGDLKQTHPSEWSLEQVIEWLKGKGFDQDICDKFAEQEITGDVLLELDANVLKTEIGILAYGKRIRIANAITELRRPPSVDYFDHYASNNPSPLHTQTLFQRSGSVGIAHATHSRSQSQSQSHHSFPGTTNQGAHLKHGHSHSMQSSSTMSVGYLQQQPQVSGNDAPPVYNGLETQQTDVLSAAVGLGIDLTPIQKRPASLSSDGALKDSHAATNPPRSSVSTNDDRGHLSESEAVPSTSSMRRRIFGRSHDSTPSFVRTSGSKGSPLPSPTIRDSDKDSTKEKEKSSPRNSGSFSRNKSKKSTEGGKHGDRLSIFGGSFVGPLSKHRKPPPSDEGLPDRSSKFTLPRLQSTIRKSSSVAHRAASPLGSPRKDKTSNSANSPVKEKDITKTQGQLRKRTASAPHPGLVSTLDPGAFHGQDGTTGPVTQGRNIMDQIGEPDHAGWMRKKGERYHGWKTRYFVLQGPHMYCLRSSSNMETRLKEYINVHGYRVTVDEGIDPGRYGFRIDHDHDKTHYFSADEKTIIREWMKAIMKATIGRDYRKPVISSCNIPTIPLVVAQAMNPAPRPPSPSARDATQRAMRRENTSQLSTRDARVLMGLPAEVKEDHSHVVSLFNDDGFPRSPVSPTRISAPSRPSRERRLNSMKGNVAEVALIEWANTHLPGHLQNLEPAGPLYGGLALLRLAESIKGQPASPPVPDIAFPVDANDDKLDGLVRLFDFLLDNDVKMGSLSINDLRQGKRDKVVQLLKALKSWEEKRKILSTTMAIPPQVYLSQDFTFSKAMKL